jgi:hypothetical protein
MSALKQRYSAQRHLRGTCKLLLATTALSGFAGIAAAADLTVNAGDSATVASGDAVAYDTITNNGIISSEGTVTATTVNNNNQAINASGGILNGTTITNNANGLLDNNGTVNSTTLTNNANGLLDNDGTINNTGTLTNNGTAQSSGLIDTATLTNTGQFQNEDGGTVTATTVNNNDGTFDNDGMMTGVTSLTNADGARLNNRDGASLGATTLTNDGVLENSAGTANSGSFSVSTLDNAGTLNNEGTGTATVTTFNNNNGGRLNNDGSLGTTTFSNNKGATVVNDGSITTTTVENSGTFTNTSGASLTGTTLNNNLGGVFNQQSGATLGFTTIVNDDGATFNNESGTTTAAVVNNGVLSAQDGALFTSTVTNNNSFNFDGTVNVSGLFTNTGKVSGQDNGNEANDVLNLNGGLASSSDYFLDVDLGGSVGMADVINITGDTSGSPYFFFDPGSPVYGLQDDPTVFFNADESGTNTYTFDFDDYEGLPTGGLIAYGVVRLDAGGNISTTGVDLGILSQVSPAVGALAAGLSLTQDLVGSVTNRPTSPFVSGLATGEPCSKGTWARLVGGQAELEGDATNEFGGGGLSTTSTTIDADYAGIQLGLDTGCFDARFNGWDLAAGMSVGFNQGNTAQTNFAAITDPGTGVSTLSSTPVGTTTTEFEQQSVGAYLAARQGNLTIDFQVRKDSTDFVLNDNPIGQFEGLGLNDTQFNAETLTASTRLNYAIDLGSMDMTFVPTIGVNASHTESSAITFASGDQLQINKYTTVLGFVGGTVARTVIAPSGTAGTTYFASANYYNDFSTDRVSVFTPTAGSPTDISTTNLGGFGEVSFGVNRVAILNGGSAGVKQLNASLRVDTRVGKAVSNAFSVTGQIRLSF